MESTPVLPAPRASKKKILVVDDEPRLVDVIALNLNLEGYDVSESFSGRQALDEFNMRAPDMVILDIVMPDMDGFEVLQKIRSRSDVPIVVVTSLSDDNHAIRALELGADDFISKPFRLDALVSQVKVTLDRQQSKSLPTGQIRVDERLFVDFALRKMIIGNREVRLRPTENLLLHKLISQAGQVVTSQSLWNTVYGADYPGQARELWLHISHLRRLIETDPETARYIVIGHDAEYCFRRQE